GEHQIVPERLDASPQTDGSRLRFERVKERVDRHHRTEHTKEFAVPPLRTMLLDVGDELLERCREVARLAGHERAGSISTRFARAHDEHLHHFRELTNEPEDGVEDHPVEHSADEALISRARTNFEVAVEDANAAHQK